MADVNIESAFAVAVQADEGVFDPGLAALSGAIAIADGLAFGDARVGLRETGIDLVTSPRMQDQQNVVGSRTRQDGWFLEELVETLTMALPMCGPRNDTTTPVDTDFDLSVHYPALDALLQGCGMTGRSWVGGTGWEYNPLGEAMVSVKAWESGTATGVRDARGTFTIKYEPLTVPLITFNFNGRIEEGETTDSEAFPAPLDYGVQLSVPAPGVEAISEQPAWDGTERQFRDLELSVDPGVVDASDSRGVRWKYGKQSTITLSGIMVVNSADLDAERNAMKLAAASGVIFTYRCGDPAGAAEPAISHAIQVVGLRPTTWTAVDVADTGCRGIQFSAVAHGTVDGGELSISFA